MAKGERRHARSRHRRGSAILLVEQKLTSGLPADAQTLLRMCEVFEKTEARLVSYANEVKAHKINLTV